LIGLRAGDPDGQRAVAPELNRSRQFFSFLGKESTRFKLGKRRKIGSPDSAIFVELGTIPMRGFDRSIFEDSKIEVPLTTFLEKTLS